MAKKFFIVEQEPSANKHLPTPLLIGEIVMEIEDENLGDQYKRIHHNRGKNISSFSKNILTVYTKE